MIIVSKTCTKVHVMKLQLILLIIGQRRQLMLKFFVYMVLSGSGKTHISKVWIKKSNAIVFNDISHLNLDYFNNFR